MVPVYPPYPTSIGRTGKASCKLTVLFFRDAGARKYLIYHVDEGLGIISTQMLNRLRFVTVGEEGRDLGDALVCGKRSADQTLPCWNVAA